MSTITRVSVLATVCACIWSVATVGHAQTANARIGTINAFATGNGLAWLTLTETQPGTGPRAPAGNPPLGCDVAWGIDTTTAGGKAVLAFLLSAYLSDDKITIEGDAMTCLSTPTGGEAEAIQAVRLRPPG